ncbi:arsenate reductase [Loktanella sp. IMCC34160]|uniref:ArsC/Spx/MgsR family protein n=1 Tax=Loktanella sp. IMCC34160 TaxID=2510646 RepID=UPI00101D7EB5|nr:ArsC/Spx/MgsR family protein [Loktanella sp. IMCC34160]RYG89309.1 arsenate reductase [Loktanella sp. IMCC34160]
MLMIGLKTCDTCRKARKALAEKGNDVDYLDVRDDGLPENLIAEILGAVGDKAVNRASTTWRGLSDGDRNRPLAALLADHPTLLKRPAIRTDEGWSVGWTPAIQQAILG